MTAGAAPHNFAPPTPPSLALGVIGNCAFTALIDQRGRLVWCCLPRFDGDPVFHALIEPNHDKDRGQDAGHNAFVIEIEDFAEARQWYEPNTAVLPNTAPTSAIPTAGA